MYRSPFKTKSFETCSFKKVGSWSAGYHTGVDRVCDNIELVSPASGVIQRIGNNDKSYGNFIIITTYDNKSILMAHFSKLSTLKAGQKISAGDFVGYMGATGNASAKHLHIEIINAEKWQYNYKLLNPNDFINWNDFENENNLISIELFKKDYINGSTPEIVYADIDKKLEIGVINPYENCTCLGKCNNLYIVAYNISGTQNYKIGFVKYHGGVK